MKVYAPFVLRIAMALVFLWFGTQQIIEQDSWSAFVPEFVQATALSWFGIKVTTIVIMNGAFEIVFGLCLMFGIYIRVAATLLAIHMAAIALSLGWNATGIRDFGLTMATLSVALYGKD